ncbi:MAG TPA: hypothetical protein VFS34_03680 [Thermoanaerobaculia bacterium]|nr:hypothetical protein [Thermoanaerobaculia bacterium]
MKADLEDLVAAGDRERVRLGASWRELESATARISSETVAGVETAGASLKWGGLFLLGAAVLMRWTKVRSGWKIGKVLLATAPMLARFASPRAPGVLSHLFRRRNSEKG